MDDLVTRVAELVAELYDESAAWTSTDIARAIIPMIYEDAAKVADSARLPDALLLHPSDSAYNQAVSEVAQSIRSRVLALK